jgi:hypothetical protein
VLRQSLRHTAICFANDSDCGPAAKTTVLPSFLRLRLRLVFVRRVVLGRAHTIATHTDETIKSVTIIASIAVSLFLFLVVGLVV